MSCEVFYKSQNYTNKNLVLQIHQLDYLQVELQLNHSEIEKNGLRRLWGVPDTSAYVGHLFRMEIPKEAFSETVNTYKVRFRFLVDLL